MTTDETQRLRTLVRISEVHERGERMEATAVIHAWDHERTVTIPLDAVTDPDVWLYLNPRFRHDVRLFARVNINAGSADELQPTAFELAPDPAIADLDPPLERRPAMRRMADQINPSGWRCSRCHLAGGWSHHRAHNCPGKCLQQRCSCRTPHVLSRGYDYIVEHDENGAELYHEVTSDVFNASLWNHATASAIAVNLNRRSPGWEVSPAACARLDIDHRTSPNRTRQQAVEAHRLGMRLAVLPHDRGKWGNLHLEPCDECGLPEGDPALGEWEDVSCECCPACSLWIGNQDDARYAHLSIRHTPDECPARA